MAKKRKVILAAALALVSFGASLAVAVLLAPGERPAGQPEASHEGAPTTRPAVVLTPSEVELDELIRQLRQKLAQCRRTDQQLAQRRRQLEIVQEQLARQAQELDDLRVKMASTVAALNEARRKLDTTRVRIVREDQANLKKTAAIYDKMDSASAGRILTDMCTQQHEDEAVKILYYMSERTAAKLLAAFEDAQLAARLCEKLKRIREQG